MSKHKPKSRKLKDVHKRFIVQQLAEFEPLQDVIAAVKERFGIELTAQSVEHYDPTKYAGKTLAAHLVDLFNDHRKRFRKEIESIPLGNKAVRVRQLAKMAKDAQKKKNYVLAARLMKQIAEECGNVFTNRHEFTGKDGKPIAVKHDHSSKTDDELLAELRSLGFDPDVHAAPETTQ